MSEEEKQAIEYLKIRLYGNEGCELIDVAQRDLRIFLNLIEKQQKVIDKMYSYLDAGQVCRNINKYSCVVKPEKCKKCIIKYFIKEVENDG